MNKNTVLGKSINKFKDLIAQFLTYFKELRSKSKEYKAHDCYKSICTFIYDTRNMFSKMKIAQSNKTWRAINILP